MLSPKKPIGRETGQMPMDGRETDEHTFYSVMSFTIVVPLLGLSIQPHQEPRFLVPLLAPATVLTAAYACPPLTSVEMKGNTHREKSVDQRSTVSVSESQADRASEDRTIPKTSYRTAWRWLLGLHVAQGILTALFFSFLHQAGLVTMLLAVNDAAVAVATGRGEEQTFIWPPMNLISSPPLETSPQQAWKQYYASQALGLDEVDAQVTSIDLHVFTWRVFMPPLHLLRPLILPPNNQKAVEVRVRLHDPPGDDWIDFRPEVEARLGPGSQHLIIANAWEDMPSQAAAITQSGYMTLLPDPLQTSLHLDTNYLPELNDFWHRLPKSSWLPPARLELLRAVIAP